MVDKDCTIRKDRFVWKIRDRYGKFLKSVIVPTDMYPLNDEMEISSSENTKQIVDENIMNIIDKVTYTHGHCYSNAEKITTLLRESGYNAVTYVGWLFMFHTQFPVHHCWTVLDGSIIDLADDFTMMMAGKNIDDFKGLPVEEVRKTLVDFALDAKKKKNSERCYPVGKPTEGMVYVGCPCNSEDGKKIYQELIRRYPDHECQRNVDHNGYNATQRLLRDSGAL